MAKAVKTAIKETDRAFKAILHMHHAILLYKT